MRKLTLFIPGFFGPKIAHLTASHPDIPVLEKCLRFATTQSTPDPGFINALWQLFGLGPVQYDHPIAAITRLVDDGQDVSGIWIRADPVSLQAGRDAVVLQDPTTFDLDKHEALIFAADIKQLFADQGLQLQVPSNNRWYLRLPEPPKINTTPIHQVAGEDIACHLPTGKDQAWWNRLANEVQIGLHLCPLNRERERRGALPINGIWMWGSGALPSSPGRNWSCVFGDEVTTQGLSILTDTPYQELPTTAIELFEQATGQQDILAVLSLGMRHQQYSDISGWQDFIAYVEEAWLAQIKTLLQKKELSVLELVTETHKFTIRKPYFMKFWKPHKTLRDYTQHLPR